MLETILFIINVYKYRPVKEVQLSGKGEVAMVSGSERVSPQTAKASWYDRSACYGRTYGKDCKTANGDVFDEEAFTMACDSQFRLGDRFRLTYNGKSIEVRCNDRGNFAKYGRLFDLSKFAFNRLVDTSKGVITVTWEKVLDN